MKLLQTNLDRPRLEKVVGDIKQALSDPKLRQESQRAVQAKIWHLQPSVSAVLSDLRADEDRVRSAILALTSKLVYLFHAETLDTTLARAGLTKDPRVHLGSTLDAADSLDLICLDAKERLYQLLSQFGWLQDFFRLYPLHFYENSFAFVARIPPKPLKAKVAVVGLGIGGSMAISGLSKHGIQAVGIEKRAEKGPRSVTSRYQNASWRAYDIAAELVDEQAFEVLTENRQRLNVTYDDGTTAVVESDRVQIIIGQAIQAALDSARRYGASLQFEADFSQALQGEYDIVALFCGAHTSGVVEGLADLMEIESFEDLDSDCQMWLNVRPSSHSDPFCTRGGEIGAEQWHYTIESARKAPEDLQRILDNLDSQYAYNQRKLEAGQNVGLTPEDLKTRYEEQRTATSKVLEALQVGETARYDYIFTNAPRNPHNSAKRDAAEDVVLDGGYNVEIKIAHQSTFDKTTAPELTSKLSSSVVVVGGDAAVPPNPLAAYGATLACEAAGSLVKLSIGIGHLNTMESALMPVKPEWQADIVALKKLLVEYYEARARAENYFQWVQTLICNLYSLPAFG